MWLQVADEQGSERNVEIAVQPTLIGRDQSCDIMLDGPNVSRHHAEVALVSEGGRAVVRDLGSTNGTKVNGRPLEGSADLRSGDVVRIGEHELRVFSRPVEDAQETVVLRGPSKAAASSAASPPKAAPRSASNAGPPPGAPLSPPPDKRRRIGPKVAIGAIVVIALVVGAVFVFRSSDLSNSEIVSRVGPATVYVELSDGGGAALASGTGWVLDAGEGFVVTSYDVVEDEGEISVGTGLDRQSATLVGSAPCDGLALLRVGDTSDLGEISLGSQEDVGPGEEVVAVGFPPNPSASDALIPTVAVVSVTSMAFDNGAAVGVPRLPNVIQIDRAIDGTSSGGPLLDRRARLVGVNATGLTDSGSRGYAVGVGRVQEVLDVLRTGSSIDWTGISLSFPSSPADLSDEGLASELLGRAVIADGTLPRSPGRQVGVFDDGPMAIVTVGGMAMDGSAATFCEAVSSRPGDSVEMTTVNSLGTEATVELRLG